MEYLFMIGVVLVAVLVVVSFTGGLVKNAPDSQVIVPWLSPDSMTSFNTSDNYFTYFVKVDPESGGLYRITYNLTAKKNLYNVRVQVILRCEKTPEFVEPKYLSITESYQKIPKGWYVSNYWTPIKADEFPCQVTFNVWVG